MVYEWDQHRDECYRLYITERKSLDEIMRYMKQVHNFDPSKRAYQTQFKRWVFPSKQNPAHRNVDLVTRVKQLWESNYSQRDMVKTLNDEGYQIKERELMRVRAKNRWLLRVPNGSKGADEEAFNAQLLAAAEGLPDGVSPDVSMLSVPGPPPPAEAEEVPEEIVRKRKDRHEKMQQESDERWAAKKRRRRTRDYAGIPADPPGPPRFPSETTLGESMEYLSLDSDLYKSVRAHFQLICEDMEIIKKTLAGSERWTQAKERLKRENSHLIRVFADEQSLPAKELALDVICTDVTKRMRTVETRMTIVDAKNTLGVNPEQSRQIRNSFYSILQQDHFTSKLETGPEHWNELKEQWIQDTPLLLSLMDPLQDQDVLNKKRKALEVLCRDVMKRLRDATKREPADTNDAAEPKPKPTPTPKKPKSTSKPQSTLSDNPTTLIDSSTISLPLLPPDLTHPMQNHPDLTFGDIQIDPSLLASAADFSGLADLSPSHPSHAALSTPYNPATHPIAVYLKHHPSSSIPLNATPKLMVGTLEQKTYAELLDVIRYKFPQFMVGAVEGIARAANGSDVPFVIESDEELGAYLDHVRGSAAQNAGTGGGKVTFRVMLAGG